MDCYDAAGDRARYGPNLIDVMGWTSQIVGIRLFKLAGPGQVPIACVMSKKSEPVIVTGMGGV